MFIWPLSKFWTYTPQGWALAVVWNVCELYRLPVPCAPWVFGVIVGRKGTKIED